MNMALKDAYELERKGLEFYISAAIKSKNALAKRTLFSLAQEEIKHMMKIDEISVSAASGKDWPKEEVGLGSSDIKIAIKEFFLKTDKDMLNADKDNAELIKTAMEFERKSFDLYSELSKKAKADPERRFFDELKAQEELHYEALENVYYYLTKTGDWFGAEESKAWNWMNA